MLPDLFRPEQLSGGIAVVIDILRASTTITTALFHGASRVIPCLTVEDALSIRTREPEGTVLLGGERAGVRIEGFDLSNSPADYQPQTVAGKTIGFTTTNGTRALHRCLQADEILIGSFRNLTPLIQMLGASRKPVHLVCAGTDGRVTGEDVLFAGAVVFRLLEGSLVEWLPDDSAHIALSWWQQQIMSASQDANDTAYLSVLLEEALRRTHGGRNLLQLNYDQDIRTCGLIDTAAIIPQFCSVSGHLTAIPAVPE